MASELKIVTETNQLPYNLICAQEIYRSRILGGRNFYSTGFLIAPNVILTAAHNIYSTSLTKVTNITVYLGKHKDSSAYDPITIPGKDLCQRAIKVNPKFSWNKGEYDFGIIVIPNSILQQGVNWPKEKFFQLDKKFILKKGDTLHVAGYPANNGYDGSVLTTQFELCDKIYKDTFSHTLDTETGNSGSPIWVESEGQYKVAGVHTYAELGTLISNLDIEMIENWIKEYEKNI